MRYSLISPCYGSVIKTKIFVLLLEHKIFYVTIEKHHVVVAFVIWRRMLDTIENQTVISPSGRIVGRHRIIVGVSKVRCLRIRWITWCSLGPSEKTQIGAWGIFRIFKPIKHIIRLSARASSETDCVRHLQQIIPPRAWRSDYAMTFDRFMPGWTDQMIGG